jgi:hypothetical protein
MSLGEPGTTASARAELEAVADALERLLGGDDLIAAGAFYAAGSSQAEVDPARAEGYFRKSAAAYEKTTGSASGATYESRSALHYVLARQRKLAEAEEVARVQLRDVREALGDGVYQTIRSKARLARTLVWEGTHADEAESLARQASQDGLAHDEKDPSGDWDAYFRAIWAGAVRLRGDAGEAERMLRSLIEARQDFTGRAGWTDGALWLELANTLIDQGRLLEADAALTHAGLELAKLNDPGYPLNMNLRETQARLAEMKTRPTGK